jgi:hypothetical protein
MMKNSQVFFIIIIIALFVVTLPSDTLSQDLYGSFTIYPRCYGPPSTYYCNPEYTRVLTCVTNTSFTCGNYDCETFTLYTCNCLPCGGNTLLTCVGIGCNINNLLTCDFLTCGGNTFLTCQGLGCGGISLLKCGWFNCSGITIRTCAGWFCNNTLITCNLRCILTQLTCNIGCGFTSRWCADNSQILLGVEPSAPPAF